jgi:hypothetical protein
MIFSRSPKKAKLTRQDALNMRPVQLVEPEIAESSGGAKLKVLLKPTRWGKLMGMPRGSTKTFELDELGLFIWKSCDGHTTVQQMIRQLARDRRISLREVEVATLQFLQTLTRKGLVGMSAETSDKTRGQSK